MLLFEGSDELGGLRQPAESSLHGEQGGVVIDIPAKPWLGPCNRLTGDRC